MTEHVQPKNGKAVRNALIVALVVVAFFVSYQIATARNASRVAQTGVASSAASGSFTAEYVDPAAGGTAGGAGGAGGAACACCGGAGSTETIEGATTVEGGVQTVSVQVGLGYDPNVIKAKAGIPLEITFSEGAGCTGQVMSKDLGFFEDLTTGPKTVKLPALEAGTYGFSCGMEMVFGEIVVE